MGRAIDVSKYQGTVDYDALPEDIDTILMQATFGMLQGLCQLNGSDIVDHLPTGPADFFNLVGMAEWLELDANHARKETSWA